MWVHIIRTIKTDAWCAVIVCVLVVTVLEVSALSGPNVCLVKQKYNITKRVKYRAPMSVRTYEWCFSMPPRCSKWNTEMRDLTRLETEERTAEVAVCCPGYKMKEVSCVPICTNGKTGPDCTEDCPPNKWGPNCIHTCKKCKNGFCSRITGECECVSGWQGESCDTSMLPTTSTISLEELLTTLSTKITTTNTTPPSKTAVTTVVPRPTVTVKTTVVTTPATSATSQAETATSTTFATITLPTTSMPTPKSNTTDILTTFSILTTTEIASTPPILTENYKIIKETTSTSETPMFESTTPYYNTTIINASTLPTKPFKEDFTRIYSHKPEYSNQETDILTTTETITPVKILQDNVVQKIHTEETVIDMPKTTVISTLPKEIKLSAETTKRETTTNRIVASTTKFRVKEIWIRPAQKGESPTADAKLKINHDSPRYRSANNKELVPAITTPKTIIVSIIPTSVSYTTFKRISLTSSYLAIKNSTNALSYNTTNQELATTPISEVTLKPQTNVLDTKEISITSFTTNNTIVSNTSVAPNIFSTKAITKPVEVTKTILHINRTNSMTPDIDKKSFSSITTNSPASSPKRNNLLTNSTLHFKIATSVQPSTERTTRNFIKHITPQNPANVFSKITPHNMTNSSKEIEKVKSANVTKGLIKLTTEAPIDDEEFHILTEPEHITAVMGDKDTDRSSVDLISVISIAGGIMMAVITVAVIIVMIERCKKPRYEDVRKINDIRMQVMIDNNDVPPPYVRSIFHTPLPEPPTSDRCHYQPISTLDRNLKQFMRPVVVQTISPIMLENFREILECHYDHLPRRSHDFEIIQTRTSLAPSMKDHSELQQFPSSVTESTIEALRCEAKLDVIDSTTSEPLYAEIPCWRPPSEHAVEILNLNGEAVTEL